jgi:hypothetical protein
MYQDIIWFVLPVTFLTFVIRLAKLRIWQADDVRRLVYKQKKSKHTDK